MKRVVKIIALLLVTFVLCVMVITSFGCTKDKIKKYDIAIKVSCVNVETGDVVEEWVFDPDVSVIEVDFDYDGTAYRFVADSYKYLDFPGTNLGWLYPRWYGPFVIKLTRQGDNVRLPSIRHKGEYEFYVDTTMSSSDIKFRSIILKITIK